MAKDRTLSMTEFAGELLEQTARDAVISHTRLNRPEREIAQDLQERFASFSEHHSFSPGDLVRFKRPVRWGNLKVGIYIREIERPMMCEIGIIDGDGDFSTIGIDVRRLEPWTSD